MPGGSARKPSAQDARTIARLNEAKARYRDELLAIPGAFMLSIGYKTAGGKKTDQLALVVSIDRKLPNDVLARQHRVPPKLTFHSETDGKDVSVITDVVERSRPIPAMPHVAADQPQLRHRPVPAGVGISSNVGSGTIGGWFWDNESEGVVLLSNEHVIGDTGQILQPWRSGGATYPADYIADVLRKASGDMDAAIAAPVGSTRIEIEVLGLGPAGYEITEPAMDMPVEKVGASTAHTVGTVTDLSVSGQPRGTDNDFAITVAPPSTRISQVGDSGSVFYEQTHPEGQPWKRAVGLIYLVAIDGSYAIAYRLSDVFARMNLTTVCAGAFQAFLDSLFTRSTRMASVPAPGSIPDEMESVPAMMGGVPEMQPSFGPKFYRGISRDFQKRIAEGKNGKMVVQHVSANRHRIAQLLMNGDARRSLTAALGPILRGRATTDQVLDHVVGADDVKRITHFLDVAARVQPEMRSELNMAAGLLQKAKGASIGNVLVGARRTQPLNAKKPGKP